MDFAVISKSKRAWICTSRGWLEIQKWRNFRLWLKCCIEALCTSTKNCCIWSSEIDNMFGVASSFKSLLEKTERRQNMEELLSLKWSALVWQAWWGKSGPRTEFKWKSEYASFPSSLSFMLLGFRDIIHLLPNGCQDMELTFGYGKYSLGDGGKHHRVSVQWKFFLHSQAGKGDLGCNTSCSILGYM